MFRFNGVGSGIDIPCHGRWPRGNLGFSICVWFKRHEAGNDRQVLLSFVNVNGRGIKLVFDRRELRYVISVAGSPDISVLLGEVDDCWNFVCVTQTAPRFYWNSDSDISIYVNGITRARQVVVYPELSGDTCFRLGCGSNGNAFCGEVSELQVFDDVLNTSEMTMLYSLKNGNSLIDIQGDKVLMSFRYVLFGNR